MRRGKNMPAAKKQKKVIITCAVTGGIHTPAMSPHLPNSPEEITQHAVDAAKAGAAIVHIHARKDHTGEPTANFDTFEQILSGIKRKSDVVIGITTGGAQGMTVEERLAVVPRFKPEMASCNGGSINFCLSRLADGMEPQYDWEIPFLERTYDNVFKNTFKDMEYAITIMNDSGTLPEFEVFDYGQLANIRYFMSKGTIRQPLYLQFVPGVMGGMPMSLDCLNFMIDQARKMFGKDVMFCSVAGGRRMFRFETVCAIQGGNVRVGMEDGLYIKPNGELAVNNAAQVAKIKGILESLDFEIAGPEEAREMLSLKGADKVEF